MLTETWPLKELGGADSKCGLSFLKFGSKRSKLSVLLEIGTHGIWRMLILIPTLVFWICTPKSIFGKFGSKRSKLSILTENWHTQYLKDDDSYSVINFLNFPPEIYFWANLGRKSQSCLFCLKIGIWDISRMLILIPTLVFWIYKKSKLLVCLKTNTYSISRILIAIFMLVFSNFKPKSRVCWFLFWD